MKDRVSVIIPVYNVEKYLDECIESVVNQTYSNLEIILVDDGSEDNSGAICDMWKNSDSRIRVIHKKNAGLGAARNSGLDIATGDYIAFLDSDDYFSRDSIDYMLNAIKSSESDIVVCGLRFFKDNEKQERENRKNQVHGQVIDEESFWEKDRFNAAEVVSAHNKLYPRRLFESLRYPEGVINEDTAILLQYIKNCNRIFWSDKKVVNYRMRQGSITHTPFSARNIPLARTYYGIIEYLIEKGYWRPVRFFFRDATDLLQKGLSRLDKKDTEAWQMLNEVIADYQALCRKITQGKIPALLKLRSRIFCLSPKLFFRFKKTCQSIKGIDIDR